MIKPALTYDPNQSLPYFSSKSFNPPNKRTIKSTKEIPLLSPPREPIPSFPPQSRYNEKLARTAPLFHPLPFPDQYYKPCFRKPFQPYSPLMILPRRSLEPPFVPKKLLAPSGLSNTGLVCYRNATLNALYAIKPVLVYFRPEQRQDNSKLGDTLHTFFQEYHRNLVRQETLNAFQDLMPAFPINTQHCAYQYFLCLFTALEEGISKKKPLYGQSVSLEEKMAVYSSAHYPDLYRMFSVVTETLYICCKCANYRKSFNYSKGLDVSIPKNFRVLAEGNCVSFGENNFNNAEIWKSYDSSEDIYTTSFSTSLIHYFSTHSSDLQQSLPRLHPQNITLEDCIHYTTRATLMTAANTLNCPKCSIETQHFKVSFLRHIGSVLVIHFQRFDEYTQGKLYMKVGFAEELDMGKYMKKGGKYVLKAVIRHNGTLIGGHYTAQIKRNGSWYNVDDSVVRRLKGGFSMSSAYVLFYEQVT